MEMNSVSAVGLTSSEGTTVGGDRRSRVPRTVQSQTVREALEHRLGQGWPRRAVHRHLLTSPTQRRGEYTAHPRINVLPAGAVSRPTVPSRVAASRAGKLP